VPTKDNFGQPLPAVAAQILRDLEGDERDLLRAAALLEAFDLEALRVACPRVPDSAIRRFKERPFLEFDPDRTWRYSLHAILRDVIRHADTDLRDSWSERERADEVYRLLASGGWGLLADLPSKEYGPVEDGPVSALLLGVQEAKERRSGRLDSSIALMGAALDRPGLSPKLHASCSCTGRTRFESLDDTPTPGGTTGYCGRLAVISCQTPGIGLLTTIFCRAGSRRCCLTWIGCRARRWNFGEKYRGCGAMCIVSMARGCAGYDGACPRNQRGRA
jgi:hypothetical protein